MKLSPAFESIAACELAGLDPNKDLFWSEEEYARFVEAVHYVRGVVSYLIMKEELRRRHESARSNT